MSSRPATYNDILRVERQRAREIIAKKRDAGSAPTVDDIVESLAEINRKSRYPDDAHRRLRTDRSVIVAEELAGTVVETPRETLDDDDHD
jgi:hypothetical protein